MLRYLQYNGGRIDPKSALLFTAIFSEDCHLANMRRTSISIYWDTWYSARSPNLSTNQFLLPAPNQPNIPFSPFCLLSHNHLICSSLHFFISNFLSSCHFAISIFILISTFSVSAKILSISTCLPAIRAFCLSSSILFNFSSAGVSACLQHGRSQSAVG